jgi:GTP-binding protein Era
VGKSTLLNQILGQKVSITSDKPQTTRTQVRGVLTRPDAQVVFVDTPGLHKPRSVLGERLNDTARSALADVDLTCFLVEANAPVGAGDRMIAGQVDPRSTILVLNKVDAASREQIAEHLQVVGEFGLLDYHPVSARTGEGVDDLVEAIVARLPEGPQWYPDDMVTDVPEAFWVAELVREQLLKHAREELPHSIAARVTEWEWPYIRCEILVERESQKGIVIGKKGAILKQVGIAVREQLPDGAYLDLQVKVDKDWQSRPAALQRLGY